jgi:hypothetical protein
MVGCVDGNAELRKTVPVSRRGNGRPTLLSYVKLNINIYVQPTFLSQSGRVWEQITKWFVVLFLFVASQVCYTLFVVRCVMYINIICTPKFTEKDAQLKLHFSRLGILKKSDCAFVVCFSQ